MRPGPSCAGEGDIYIASGVEDMEKVPMMFAMDISPKILDRYNMADLPMGNTAEKVAEKWKVSRKDAEVMAYWSNKKAAAARDNGKFAREIVPIEGEKEDGTKFMVATDQWIRDDVSLETDGRHENALQGKRGGDGGGFFSADGGCGGAAPHERGEGRRSLGLTITSSMPAAPWSDAIRPSWASAPSMPPRGS